MIKAKNTPGLRQRCRASGRITNAHLSLEREHFLVLRVAVDFGDGLGQHFVSPVLGKGATLEEAIEDATADGTLIDFMGAFLAPFGLEGSNGVDRLVGQAVVALYYRAFGLGSNESIIGFEGPSGRRFLVDVWRRERFGLDPEGPFETRRREWESRRDRARRDLAEAQQQLDHLPEFFYDWTVDEKLAQQAHDGPMTVPLSEFRKNPKRYFELSDRAAVKVVDEVGSLLFTLESPAASDD